jgi:hypothetical protein
LHRLAVESAAGIARAPPTPTQLQQQRAPELAPPQSRELTISHEQLVQLLTRGEAGKLGLNRSQLERYLSSAEFERVFGVSQAQFAALARWRQHALKKRAGLF